MSYKEGFHWRVSLQQMSLLPPLPSRSFCCLTRLALTAVSPRILRLQATTITMAGSRRLLSSISDNTSVSKKQVEVESNQKEVKVQVCGDLQTMTLQQLRTMSKNIGISARGSKQALVSALQCFLQNEEDGQSSPVNLEKNSSNLEIPSSVSEDKNSSVLSKGKANIKNDGTRDQNPNHVTEISGSKKRKRRGKSPGDDGISLEVNSKALILEHSLSDKAKETSGSMMIDKKSSQTKRKELSKIDTEDGGSTDKLGQAEKSSEPWMILAHKKPQVGWVPYNPKTMRPPPLEDGTNSVKLISWNVNGLRALLKLDSLLEFAHREDFDVLCLQETKLQEKDVVKIRERLIDGYDNSFWTCSVSKLGYSGTAIISRIKPLSIKYGLGILDHDSEGRLVTVEFDKFYLISGYVPNSGDGLRRLTYRVTQWDPSLGEYMKELEKSKPVILAGDLNCAHQEIDIFNPAGNKRTAGFTIEERESFEKNFLSKGFVDTFRRQHPGVVGYTYWGFRHGGRVENKGWRLDYFLVSEAIADQVHDSYIVPDVTGSDHCPVGLILKL